MELRTLKYFATVAEELNITKAAAILNISQPPLSAQIKKLEEELDTQLFIRGKRSLKLTDSGQLLYRRAKEMLRLSEQAQAEIRSMNSGITGTISLGLVEGIAPSMAAEWIAGFLTEYPRIKFLIVDGSSDELTEKMRSGIISLAVITDPYDQLLLNSFNVAKGKMTAIISKQHPLSADPKTPVSIRSLANQPLIIQSRKATERLIYKWFQADGTEPSIVCRMDSYLDAVALAEKNVGISIFPQTFGVRNDNVVIRPLQTVNSTVDYLFTWRKGHPLPVAEEKFIDYVKALVL
ncbi:MAG: LysR family transcriptional regulator [Bacillota bacterium]|nr:LysR family transcriptional regulator [Bacillota bacterium]